MSVSLKKPEREEKKLPECTPVHHIDEEETIKNRPVHSVTSKTVENDLAASSSEVLKETLLNEAAEYEAERNKHKKWYALAYFGAFALIISVCVAVFFLVVNIPVDPVETSAEGMSAVEYIFSLFSSVIGYILKNPLCMLIISISFISLAVRCVRQIMNNRF